MIDLDLLLAEALAPRVIRLIHKAATGEQTILGNFLEKPCRAGRRLIPCDSPTCVCEEFVHGDYWLSSKPSPTKYEDSEMEQLAIRDRFFELINQAPIFALPNPPDEDEDEELNLEDEEDEDVEDYEDEDEDEDEAA